MKKAFCFLTALTLILFGASCTKNNGNPMATAVKTPTARIPTAATRSRKAPG